MPSKISREEFISRSQVTHGGKYDYSLSVFLGVLTPCKIICKLHGEFTQRPRDHYGGQNCPKCANLARTNNQTSNTDEFIKKAIVIHGSLYNYSQVSYVSSDKKVVIICKKHGKFLQAPNKHLMGRRCPVCFKKPKKDTQSFILEAIKTHGNKYNYSSVEYRNIDHDITIICPNHGEFTQTPYHHIRGSGCSSCASYGFDYNKPAILYFVKILHEGSVYYKIGITNRTIQERFTIDEFSKMTILSIVEYPIGRDAFNRERHIIKENHEHVYNGPPILFNGNSEIFTSNVLARS